MSRREFLKKAAGALGAIAVGALTYEGASKLHETAEVNRQKEQERTHQAGAIILEKDERQMDFVPIMPGDGAVINVPLKKEIRILLNGKEENISITKEQFDAFKVGDEIMVSYEEVGEIRENIRLIERE